MTLSAVLVAVVIKPAAVIAVAAVLVRACRRLGAAVRHAIWAGAIIATPLLPLLASVTPPMPLPDRVTRAWQAAERGAVAASNTTLREPPAIGADTEVPAAAANRSRDVPIAPALIVAWLGVALALLGRRAASHVAYRRMIARARPAPATLVAQCAVLARSIGVRQPVRLMLSDEVRSPAVGGVVASTIVLPPDAERWAAGELRAVLVHELAHVARRDCAVNLVADIAAAIYWCNPAMLFALHRLRAEGERACDDRVLHSGTDPDSYASLLLALARASRLGSDLPRAVTAMARPSELETRVLAVLDPRIPRRPMRPWLTLSVATLTASLALPVAAATLRAESLDPVIAVMAPEPDRAADSITHPASELLPRVDIARARAAGARALTGPDSLIARTLLLALSHVPMHANDFVRDRAAWALAQESGGELVPPMVEALDAGDWRVQSYAAWTLAVARDARAVPRLVELARHPVWRLRVMSAAALNAIGDRRAADVMLHALADPAWQVRTEAIEYLAAVDTDAHSERIRELLADRHVAVRRAAARALDPR